jgi:hypothetical protein
MRGARAGTIAIALVLAVVPGAVAKRRMLPKHTPYAAEVQALVSGHTSIDYSDTDTTFKVCEGDSATTSKHAVFDFDWSARYPQVTVPIADARELGKAATKLHVRQQPTAKGKGGMKSGTYTISGEAPPTSGNAQASGGSDCTEVPYSTNGSWIGSPPFFEERSLHDAFGSKVFYFVLSEIFDATPNDYAMPDGTPMKAVDDLRRIEGMLPDEADVLEAHPTYNSVPVDFPIDKLKTLAHSATLAIPTINWKGSRDCSSGESDVDNDTCTLSWDGFFTVTLKKRFPYYTKRAYPR